LALSVLSHHHLINQSHHQAHTQGVDYYEIWCDLRDSSQDVQFCSALDTYLGYLKEKGFLEGHKVKRRKLGFSPDGWGEFNISIEFRDMAQMDLAFNRAATRDPEVEPLHRDVYSRICNTKFALYRDFPDPVRTS
jgi:hypothetical protein